MALEVQIGADSSNFDKEISKVEKQLNDLRKQEASSIKLGLDTTALKSQISDATTKLNGLKSSVNSSASAFQNHARATANGGNTLMQFSRIAQDAPFGIIGIGNNLTATAESFGHLAKSSGGAGNALKAVASSIMGVGGILLAVSLVTSALTYMSQNGITVGDVFSKLTGTFDEYSNSVKKASEEGIKASGKEVQSLHQLVAVAQNDNIAKRDRLDAVDKLQKQFSAYYGNLSAEKIMYGDLTKETNLATEALVARAIAEKLGDKAADKFVERLNAQKKFNDEKKRLEAFDLDIAQQQARVEKEKGKFLGITQDIIDKQLSTRPNILKSIEKERQNLIKLVVEYDKYGNLINKLSEKAAPLDRKAPDAPKVEKEAFKRDTAFDKEAENALQGRYDIEAGIVKRGEEAKYKEMLKGQELQKKLAEERTRIALEGYAAEERARMKSIDGLKSDLAAELILLKSYLDSKAITQEQYDLMAQEQRLKSLEAQRALVPEHQIISNAIVGTIQNMGTALGEALATGANIAKSMGSALLAGLGGLLSAMGDHLIKIGTAAVLAGTVMKLFGTVTGVGAGLAAIAGGVLLKGVGGAIAAKGNRNINNSANNNSGGTGQRGSISSGADVSSPTSSVSSGGTFNNSGGTVVFEIAGQKLIGVLNNTTQGNLRLGGSGLVG
jgi:hypothetical protein